MIREDTEIKSIWKCIINRTSNPSRTRRTNTSSHKRQWCLRRRHPKLRPHLIQELVFRSGIQIAGTHRMIHFTSGEWPRFSFFSFSLPFLLGRNETLITSKLLQLARKVPSRSSDGGKGRQMFNHLSSIGNQFQFFLKKIIQQAFLNLGMILQRNSNHRLSTTISPLHSCFSYVSYR